MRDWLLQDYIFGVMVLRMMLIKLFDVLVPPACCVVSTIVQTKACNRETNTSHFRIRVVLQNHNTNIESCSNQSRI